MNAEHNILKTLLYFDIFDYPLTKDEIIRFSSLTEIEKSIDESLKNLVTNKEIWVLDEFYSLKNNPSLVLRRKDGNKRAESLLKNAYSISQTLAKFPFVRGIGISGSLSKFFADKNADIDYFIITHSNRLWIARTLMHLYKKLPFIRRNIHFYCMNYYVDEIQLQIEEKNVYTATELLTLLPMYGNGSIENLYDANQWAFSYFPNLNIADNDLRKTKTPKDGLIKKIFELLFNNRFGNWLDNYLLKITRKRWQHKEDQKKLNQKGGRMGFKMSKNCCKPNPRFFHDNFIKKYESRIAKLLISEIG